MKTLRLLDGIVDIYIPDAKYGSDDVAITLSHTGLCYNNESSNTRNAPSGWRFGYQRWSSRV